MRWFSTGFVQASAGPGRVIQGSRGLPNPIILAQGDRGVVLGQQQGKHGKEETGHDNFVLLSLE